MVRNFFSTPNVFGRLLIILLFAGGVVFAGAFDGFVVETEASSCCGGGMDDAIFSSSGNNGGGGGGKKCGCLGDTTDCGCGANPACGGSTTDYCGSCKCLNSCCTEKKCKAYASCDSATCTHSAD